MTVREPLDLVPYEQEPIFGFRERVLIVSAIEALTNDTFNITAQAVGDGPICLALAA